MNENQLKDEIHRRMVEHSEMKSFGVHRTASDSAAMYAVIGAMAIGTLGYIAMLFVAEAHAVFVSLCCAVLGGFLGYASAPGEARTRPAGCTFFGGLLLTGAMIGLPFLLVRVPSISSPPATSSQVTDSDLANMSWAHKMANINAGAIVPVTDPSVGEFQRILDNHKRKWPDKSEQNFADTLVHTWNQVRTREDVTLLEFSKKMDSI